MVAQAKVDKQAVTKIFWSKQEINNEGSLGNSKAKVSP